MLAYPIKISSEYISFIKEIYGLNGFIAGSFAASCSGPNIGFVPNDIDIWPRTESSSQYILNYLKTLNYVYYKGSNDLSHYMHLNARVHSFVPSFPFPFLQKIQFIEFPNEPIEIINNTFDFSICKVYIENLNTLILSDYFFQDLVDKRLRYNCLIKRPGNNLIYRLNKYIERKYLPNFEDCINMISSINDSKRDFINTLSYCLAKYDKDLSFKLKCLYKMECI